MGVNVTALKEKIETSGYTPEQAAAAMGMHIATYYRKLKAQGVKFTVGEMQSIIQLLHLTETEASQIFFTETVA